MIIIKRFIAIAIILLFTSNCWGQSLDLKFKHLTSENGLPQNGIFGIVKDKYGFMWFGTWSGLCRYDGYRFKIYRHEPGNLRSVINSRITDIVKDNNQNIWVHTHNDSVLCKYNYETDDFDRIPAKSLSKAFLDEIDWDKHRYTVSMTYHGYKWSIDPKTDRLTQVFTPTNTKRQYVHNVENRWSINDSFVSDIYLDDQRIFWVGTYSDGINMANLNVKPFHYYYHNPNDRNSIIDNHVRAISQDKLGNLWIGTRTEGITIISPNSHYRTLTGVKGSHNAISNSHIKMLYCDSSGYMWIGTLTGLDRYNPSTDQIRHFTALGIGNAAIFAATQDYNHNVWFATWSGLYEYNAKADSLIHVYTGADLKSNKGMAVIQDRGKRLWVGTEGGGISVFANQGNGRLKLLTNFLHNDNVENTISDNRIYSIYEDKDGFVWIATGHGLDRYDPQLRKFKHFGMSAEGLTSATIAAITEDRRGFIWISHKKGISQIDEKTFAIRNYSTQDGLQSNEFSDHAVYQNPTNGTIYFGGNNGLNAFDPDSIKTDTSIPKVVLTEIQVLNKPVQVNDTVNGRVLLKKPLYLTKEITLNYRDKSIAIEFAGLHFANPSGNKYAYMLEGFDKNWIYTSAASRVATYSNLSRGTYTFKVKASNSDGIWNQEPTTLKITVMPPWWTSTIAFILYTIIVGSVLYAFFYYSRRYDRLKTKSSFEAMLLEKEIEMRQSKIEFFTNISHEIKTPLSLILAPIDRIVNEDYNKELLADQLRIMKDNGDRLTRLINQLLDIRRFETKNDELKLEGGDLGAFVEKVTKSFSELAFERNIFLTYDSPNGVLRTAFDHDKLEKVLYNLLSNAFKFTAAGGHVIVSLKLVMVETKEWVVIEIEDDGVGIGKNDLPRIFKPFQQAATNHVGGTGLGLAYVKTLVEAHGGTIDVESTINTNAPNRTCFTVILPYSPTSVTDDEIAHLPIELLHNDIAGDQYPDDVEDEPKYSLPDNGKAPILLLVEDNNDLRRYLSRYFQANYTVVEASNGCEAVTLANSRTPDLVLSDMMMPEMNGLELCKILKGGVMTRHIPIILLTAKSDMESQITGMENGADDYITKPFNLKLLSLKIRVLLEARATLREKYKGTLTIQPSTMVPVSPDEKLLKNVLDFIDSKLGDSSLGVEDICYKIGLSSSQLYRKMKALTGLSTVDLIKQIRLKRAQELLSNKKFNVNEIAYMVGFTDVDYFRKCFKAQFGVSPSTYTKMPENLSQENN